MDKKEKRPGYFSRLKKRRQLKQGQSEGSLNEHDLSNASQRAGIITEQQEKGLQEEHEKRKESEEEKTDDCSHSATHLRKERQRPAGTVEYTVCPSDTLNNVAVKFNITPNKLVQLNRLFSRSLYPGQKLFVPDTGQCDEDTLVKGSSEADQNTAPKTLTQPCSQGGLSLRRELSPASEDESPATVKFIKMSCKYFTDGMGVVGGVMIVTPNNIMFDPHKSDPVVIEHGCEEYGLICPMDALASVALYDDVSRMHLKDALPSDRPQDLCPLYRPGEWEELPSDSDLNPFSRYQAQERDEQAQEARENSTPPLLASTPSDEGFTELQPLGGDGELQAEHQDHQMDGRGNKREEEELDEGLHTRSLEDASDASRPASGLAVLRRGSGEAPSTTKGLKEGGAEADDLLRSRPGHDSGDLGKPSTPQGPKGVKEEARCRGSSEVEIQSWLQQRMQEPIENMLLSSEEKSKAPPMFLCFKVAKPMRKSFVVGTTSSPACSPGNRGKLFEYWFAVPQERVDDLYSFFVRCSPDVYGTEGAEQQGFILVERDQLNMIDNFFSEVPRNWEIITISEAKRRQSFGSFEEPEPVDFLPCLSDASALLDDTHIHKLAARLPARVQGYRWQLMYSTVVHGTSLKTLYRNLAELDCPVLLVIKDMEEQVFGAFSTHPFRVSEHCYGTGETFLFSFCPEIKVYRWSGDNSYFVKGDTDSLQLGGGGGHMGLWLDADLYHGTSSPCSTFRNPTLSSQEDFTVHSLEVWAFD